MKNELPFLLRRRKRSCHFGSHKRCKPNAHRDDIYNLQVFACTLRIHTPLEWSMYVIPQVVGRVAFHLQSVLL